MVEISQFELLSLGFPTTSSLDCTVTCKMPSQTDESWMIFGGGGATSQAGIESKEYDETQSVAQKI
uniref:Uncharacterized protein n=1 Tax=Pristionchus pacificus TaxID=54126 RepID=A0A2A6BX13_PRIPA|eukprot:PDM70418.1 hypothetical protein PRIPAC_46664 [Pristionchus pacificus]